MRPLGSDAYVCRISVCMQKCGATTWCTSVLRVACMLARQNVSSCSFLHRRGQDAPFRSAVSLLLQRVKIHQKGQERRCCTLVRAQHVVLLRSLLSVSRNFCASSRHRASLMCFVHLVPCLYTVLSQQPLLYSNLSVVTQEVEFVKSLDLRHDHHGSREMKPAHHTVVPPLKCVQCSCVQ